VNIEGAGGGGQSSPTPASGADKNPLRLIGNAISSAAKSIQSAFERAPLVRPSPIFNPQVQSSNRVSTARSVLDERAQAARRTSTPSASVSAPAPTAPAPWYRSVLDGIGKAVSSVVGKVQSVFAGPTPTSTARAVLEERALAARRTGTPSSASARQATPAPGYRSVLDGIGNAVSSVVSKVRSFFAGPDRMSTASSTLAERTAVARTAGPRVAGPAGRVDPIPSGSVPASSASARPEAPPVPRYADLGPAAQREVDRLKQQLAQAQEEGDIESVRALRALQGNPERLQAYVAERAQLGSLFDGLQQAGPLASGLDKDAFITAAQAERSRLAEQMQQAQASGDIESVRALRALTADAQRASDYLLQRTLSSLSYDAARKDPQAAALIQGLDKEEYANVVQRAQAELGDQRRELVAQLARASSIAEGTALQQRIEALDQHANDYLTVKLAAASESEGLRRQLAAGGLAPDTAAYYQGLLVDPAKLEERVALGQMYDARLAKARAQGPEAERTFLAQAGSRQVFLQATQEYRAAYAQEYEAQAQAVAQAARASGTDPQAAGADTTLVDARTQFALLYKDAQKGKGDSELVRQVQAGNISLTDFVDAGVGRLQAKRDREKADADIARVLQQRNPSLPADQMAADAMSYNALFFDIQDSQAAFRKKVDAFNAMPSFYRGASRIQVGYDDVYAQKDEIGRQYTAINAKFAQYEDLAGRGQGSTPEARALETELRAMLAKTDQLSQRSIDASLGRAATVGPVIDVATDLMVYGASTFIPGGWAVAGGFSTLKGGMKGEVHDVGSGVLSFAKGAAFAKLGALGKAGTFTEAGTAVVKFVGLQGIKWLPTVAGVALESGAMGLTNASLTAIDLAHQGRFDVEPVLQSAAAGLAFGIATAGVARGSASLGQAFLGDALGSAAARRAGGIAVGTLSGGLSNAAGDALTQLSESRQIDPGRVVLAGLAGAGATAALSRASYLETKGRLPASGDPTGRIGNEALADLVGDVELTPDRVIPLDRDLVSGPVKPVPGAQATALPDRVIAVDQELIQIRSLTAQTDRDSFVRAGQKPPPEPLKPHEIDLVIDGINRNYAEQGVPVVLARVGDEVVKLQGRQLLEAFRAGDPARAAAVIRAAEGQTSINPDLAAAIVRGDALRVAQHLYSYVAEAPRGTAGPVVHAPGAETVDLSTQPLSAGPAAPGSDAGPVVHAPGAGTVDLSAQPLSAGPATAPRVAFTPPTPEEMARLRAQLTRDLQLDADLPDGRNRAFWALGYAGENVDQLVDHVAATKMDTVLSPPSDRFGRWWRSSANVEGPSGAKASLTVVWEKDPASDAVRLHRVWADMLEAPTPPREAADMAMQKAFVEAMRRTGVAEIGVRSSSPDARVWYGVGGGTVRDAQGQGTNPLAPSPSSPEIVGGRPVFPRQARPSTGAIFPTKPGGVFPWTEGAPAVTLGPEEVVSLDAARAAQGLPPLHEAYPDLPIPRQVTPPGGGERVWARQLMLGGAKPVIVNPVRDAAGRIVDGNVVMAVPDVDIVYARGADGHLLNDAEIMGPNGLRAAINRAYGEANPPAAGYEIVNHGAHFNGLKDPELVKAHDLDAPKYWDGPVHTFAADALGYVRTAAFGETYRRLVDPTYVPTWRRGAPGSGRGRPR
jgi:hypothetical protein